MNKNRQELDRLSEEDAFDLLVRLQSQEERASLLDEICEGNTELRTRLEGLLYAHDREDGLVDELEDDLLALPPSPVAPRKIGDCQIKGEIGRGGMGVVYEAHQVSLNRPVAVKVLSAGLVFSPQATRRFRKEAEAAARLHHTNIVPIFATGSDQHSPYYVMELVPGPSLEQVLRAIRSEKCLSNETDSVTGHSHADSSHEHDATHAVDCVYAETKRVAAAVTVSSSLGAGGQYFDNVAGLVAEVADGLAHAHHEGIIHRDIKPANLLFSREGRLCITDFGLAKVLSSPGVTLTGELLGSPRYMSPEQIALSQGRLDHRTDIYSLGATLYELLTLQPAFPGNQRDQVLTQVLHKEPRPPRQLNPQIPIDLETICRKAMEKAPEDRYQNADSMAEDLRRFVRRHVISTRRIGPIGRTWKWCRRNRTVALLSTLLATTIIAATCVTLWQQVSRNRELNRRIQAVGNTVQSLANEHPWEAVKEAYDATDEYPLHRDDFVSMIEPVTQELRIETDRPGSVVMVRPTNDPSGEWLTLGTTPLVTRLPHDWYHVRFLPKSGQSLLVLEQHHFEQEEWSRILPTERGMVAIPDSWHEGDHDACRVTWLLCRQLPSVEAFQMDCHEVTNAEYKQFVDAGGYEDDRDDLWRPLLGDSWRETVREFRDRENRYPGPLTWRDGSFRPGDERMPVVGISWYEAMAYAKWKGKQLPTIFHWLRAADFNGWHDGLEVAKHSNVGRIRATPWAAGESNARISANRYGVFDMTGNVKEWCLNEDRAETRYVLGGSWKDTRRCLYRPASYSPLERREDIGFRCASYAHRTELASAAPITWREMPTAPADVERYRETWAYAEEAAWNESPRRRCQLDEWQVDRIEFDAVYGENERITCFVALPNREHFAPPFQVVVVASGVSVESDDMAHLWSNRSSLDWFGTLIAAGRAVVVPTLYDIATNRRRNEYVEYPGPDDGERYKGSVVRMGQDISRTVDFIEQDVALLGEDLFDDTRIAYLGRCPKSMCWLVADRLASGRQRFQAAIFLAWECLIALNLQK